MSYSSSNPERLADEIDELVSIGGDSLDEFTQQRYLMKLDRLREQGRFGPAEYRAYSKLLFQMGRIDDALRLNKEALETYSDITLLSVDALEKMYLWQTNRYNFDPVKEYFEHPVNGRHEHLRFHFAHHEIALGTTGTSVPLHRPFVGTVAVHPESGLTAELGPYEIEHGYQDAEEKRFSPYHLVSLLVIESWLVRRQTEEEKAFVEERLGNSGTEALAAAAATDVLDHRSITIRLWEISVHRWVGYCETLNLATFGETRERAIDNLREKVEYLRGIEGPVSGIVDNTRKAIEEG